MKFREKWFWIEFNIIFIVFILGFENNNNNNDNDNNDDDDSERDKFLETRIKLFIIYKNLIKLIDYFVVKRVRQV